MQLQLTHKALEAIKDNGVLFGEIADCLQISPISLPRILNQNHVKLTQVGVLNIIKKHIPGIKEKDLLEKKEVIETI